MKRKWARGKFRRSFLWLDEFECPEIPLLGRYTSMSKGMAEWKTIGVPCPYCRGTLEGVFGVPDANRIVSVGDVYDRGRKQRAVIHTIPSSHRVLRCRPCRQQFTIPTDVGTRPVADSAVLDTPSEPVT